MDREKPFAFTAVLRDLNKLNTFVRVAQWRSFTKAAAELRTRPSVVSKRMKELEESLGFNVLNRSTHGLALTEAGHPPRKGSTYYSKPFRSHRSECPHIAQK